MAAVDKVLKTYELLEHIITFVPPGNILKMERVCKTWRSVIQDSVSITRVRCVAPKGLRHEDPVYEVNTELHINPALHPRDRWTVFDTSEPTRLHEQLFTITSEQLSGCGKPSPNEYLTNPPVCALTMRIAYEPGPQNNWCLRGCYKLVESNEGLRMRDLDSFVAEKLVDEVLDQVEGYFLEELEDRFRSEM